MDVHKNCFSTIRNGHEASFALFHVFNYLTGNDWAFGSFASLFNEP